MSPSGDDDAGDHLTVEYRLSPGKVFHLIEQLSEEQEELVRSIGFGGLLDLPRYDKLDRHFSAWLFNQITTVTTGAAAAASMSDGGGAEVPVTARDVHEVLGVPHGPRPVGLGAMEGDVVAVRRALGLNPREGQQVTLKYARKVLEKLTAPPPPLSSSGSSRAMAQPERDAFVVAFLVFVVGHFLAPRGPGERINAEVFHALANPSEVGQFDWAGYVLRLLLDCAGRVRRQLAGGGASKSKIELSGCLLFLQVFYLERLDSERPQPERWPRIAAYDSDTLRAHIEEDRRPVRREGGLKPFGKLRFATPKDHQELPRRWSETRTEASGSTTTADKGPELGSGCEFVTVTDPLQQPISPVTQPGKSNCTRSRDPYICPDTELNQHEDTDMDEDEEFEAFKSFFQMRKPREDRRRSYRNQVSHLPIDEQDLLGRHQVIEPTSCQSNLHQPGNVVIDLEPDQSYQKDVAYEAENEPSNKRQRVHARPPERDANACLNWFKSCTKDSEQLKWAWIVHNKPTPIEVTGESIRLQFVCGSSLRQDICNLMMRLFLELDDKIYVNSEPRQRHFLPADWAALAMEHGSNLITESSPTVRSMFCGPHIIYDVKLCRMVIAPVQCRKGEWSCYVWDFKEKRLTILDPLINQSGTNEQDVQSRHDSIKHVLHGALIACRSKYCSSSCQYDMDHEESSSNGWPIIFLRGLGGKHVFKSYNSGLYTLHFAREFDGTKLETVRKIDELRKELLYELLTMGSNTGRLPPTLPIRELPHNI
ncbi:unnamed protein product [Urochloa decumbens]|uniref:Aminotransferase-like plant mobile domain-containing protein n=1 Tax=Urochloa decumbens TaxID=240449 RepID=A0ABC8YTF0_9POAL